MVFVQDKKKVCLKKVFFSDEKERKTKWADFAQTREEEACERDQCFSLKKKEFSVFFFGW